MFVQLTWYVWTKHEPNFEISQAFQPPSSSHQWIMSTLSHMGLYKVWLTVPGKTCMAATALTVCFPKSGKRSVKLLQQFVTSHCTVQDQSQYRVWSHCYSIQRYFTYDLHSASLASLKTCKAQVHVTLTFPGLSSPFTVCILEEALKPGNEAVE